jgi:putative DNA primase/helicase
MIDPITGLPDPKEAERDDKITAFIWRLYCEGLAPEAIAARIKAEGNGAPITDELIADIKRRIERQQLAQERQAKVGSEEPIEFAPGKLEAALGTSEKLLHGLGFKYFERNRELVHTVYARDLEPSKDYERDEASVIISVASTNTIVADLDRLANFYHKGEKDGKPITIRLHVPKSFPEHLKNRVATKPREVPYPTLDLVTPAPVLLPSGRVSMGMFEEGIFFIPHDRKRYKPIPENPTKDEAIEAMKLFEEVFGGFPFVDPDSNAKPLATASYSVVLSAVFSLAARPYLRFGPTPLHGFTAHMQRSGKSKLAKAATAAALGHTPTMIHYRDEEELGKHLLPLMRSADRAIAIDNIEHTLESSKLCTLLTECVLRDRVLGESLDLTLRNTSVFFVTGNNLMIGGDLSVRSLRCDIDAVMERPEERKFSFDPVQRALEMHPELNRAALMVLRAFILAGKPWTLKRELYGGFELWDSLVSGALVWLGFADPYQSRQRVIGDDPNREADLTLLEALAADFGTDAFTVSEIDKSGGTFASYKLLLKNGVFEPKSVGWRLKRLVGRIAGGLRLRKSANPDGTTGKHSGQYWRIEKLDGQKLEPEASENPSF